MVSPVGVELHAMQKLNQSADTPHIQGLQKRLQGRRASAVDGVSSECVLCALFEYVQVFASHMHICNAGHDHK